MNQRLKKPPSLKVSRDTILFVLGIAGVIYETVAQHVDRPSLLALFGGMLGLPYFLRRDDKSDDDDERNTKSGE